MATRSPGRHVAWSASVTASTQPEVMTISSGDSEQPEFSQRRQSAPQPFVTRAPE